MEGFQGVHRGFPNVYIHFKKNDSICPYKICPYTEKIYVHLELRHSIWPYKIYFNVHLGNSIIRPGQNI